MRSITTPMFSLLLAALLAGPGHAADSAPGDPCSGPERALLDFWIGDWVVSWQRQDGTRGQGANHVEAALGHCAIVEHYRDETTPFAGMSLIRFNPYARVWQQAWADNSGGSFNAVGRGGSDAQEVVFSVDSGASKMRYRMRFSKISRDSFVWEYQAAPADRAGDPEWTVLTRSEYRRVQR